MNITLPKKFNLKNISGAAVLQFSRRASHYLLWMLFLVVMGWVGYSWYSALYDYEWSEEQKNQYRSEYSGQTSFRTERFNHTAETLEERTRLHQAPPAVKRDIFIGVPL